MKIGVSRPGRPRTGTRSIWWAGSSMSCWFSRLFSRSCCFRWVVLLECRLIPLRSNWRFLLEALSLFLSRTLPRRAWSGKQSTRAMESIHMWDFSLTKEDYKNLTTSFNSIPESEDIFGNFKASDVVVVDWSANSLTQWKVSPGSLMELLEDVLSGGLKIASWKSMIRKHCHRWGIYGARRNYLHSSGDRGPKEPKNIWTKRHYSTLTKSSATKSAQYAPIKHQRRYTVIGAIGFPQIPAYYQGWHSKTFTNYVGTWK